MFCKLILPSNEIHKLCSVPTSYQELVQIILNKLKDDIPEHFVLKYKDSDNELITISNDEDLQTAVTTSNEENQKTLRIFILPHVEHLTDISPPKHDMSENALPGIPEVLERSRSSLGEVGMLESYVKPRGNREEERCISPEIRFDLDKIPRTQSLILDDDTMTSLSEKPTGTSSKDKKVFNFARTGSTETAQTPEEQGQGFLTKEKLEIIEKLIEEKITQGIQEKLQNIIQELLAKYDDECVAAGGNMSKSYPYQCGFFPGNFNRLNVRRHTTSQVTRNSLNNQATCSECSINIKGIKYYCLTCPKFACCEACEGQATHPHPLLKVRPSQNRGSEGNNDSETIETGTDNNEPVVVEKPQPFLVRNPGRRSTVTVNPTLFSMSSAINLPDIRSYPGDNDGVGESGIGIRRGESMGTLFGNGVPMHSKIGQRCDNDCRFRARITNSSTYDVLTVKPGAIYTVPITIKNLGDIQWCNSVKLVCINGHYKEMEFDVFNLHPLEERVFSLSLTAPHQPGRFLSQWKLCSCEEGVQKQFGKAVFVEIEVTGKEKPYREGSSDTMMEKQEEEEEEASSGKPERRGNKIERKFDMKENAEQIDRKLMREIGCSEQVLSHAKALNDMFPGELKEKIHFIEMLPRDLNINDIVTLYLSKIGKRRVTWSNGRAIS